MTEGVWINALSTNQKKLDMAVAVIEYQMKKRQARIERISKNIDLNEDQRIFIGEETELIKNFRVLIDVTKNRINEALGKLPPHATELEIQVLGACLLHSLPMESRITGRADLPAPFQVVRKFLRPEHFRTETHQIIYKSFFAVDVPNLHNVVDHLRKTGQLELVGGAAYVAGLHANSVSAANVEYHARVIIEMAIKRQLILLAGDLYNGGYEDSKDCFELLDESENEFKNIRSWIK
jgi:hypothetical protein